MRGAPSIAYTVKAKLEASLVKYLVDGLAALTRAVMWQCSAVLPYPRSGGCASGTTDVTSSSVNDVSGRGQASPTTYQ